MSKKNKNTNKVVKNTEEVVTMENIETVEVEVMNMDDLTIEERKVIQDLRMKKEKKEKSILSKGVKLGEALKAKVMESKRNKIIAGVGAGLAVVGATAAVIALGSNDEEITEGEYDLTDEEELEILESYDDYDNYEEVELNNEENVEGEATE